MTTERGRVFFLPTVILALLLVMPVTTLADSDTANSDDPSGHVLVVSDEQRAAAEAYWLMMSQMQGVDPEKSPVMRDWLRRGVVPAPMGERNISDGAGGHEAHGAARIWSEEEYIQHYNRLGATPPPGGYEAYLERQGVEVGDDRQRIPFMLDQASMDHSAHGAHAGHGHEGHGHEGHEGHDGHMEQMAKDMGMEGATVKRGREYAAADVKVKVTRDVGPTLDTHINIDDVGFGRLKAFDIRAIEKDIVYSRFGDHDPNGLLYVLAEDKQRVLNCEGYECGHDPLHYGSRRDPTTLSPQPLIIRANVGDVVVMQFTNEIADQRASIHIHKALYEADTSAGSFAGFNPDTTIGPGETIRYTWEIPNSKWAEGIYYFYSHADPRYQVPHGLLGALIVEPKGSYYLDTETGEPLKAGWGAIIANDNPYVPDFREYVIMFQDRLELIDAQGNRPQDLWTGVQDAGGKGLGYRSAPFFNMMNLFLDESMAYSAYTFGDFSTPTPRWYLGDPMRVRVIHGGSGEHHVFHNHAHRWRVNPFEATDGRNLTDVPKGGERDLIFPVSTRIDSQTMGPGEVFDVFMEGGAGGVQRTVGDVLFHCHIIEHVVEGMWSYHRIYNTLQDDLAPLPDRTPLPQAVSSTQLLANADAGNPAVVHMGGRFFGEAIDRDNIEDWLTYLLPPSGVPEEELIIDPEHGNRTQNKSNMWDWVIEDTPAGPLALGEPYDFFFGPGFPAPGEGVGAGPVGERPELLFNPIDGRLAYPHLKPQLGRRPPFAPIRDDNPDLQGTAYLGLILPDGAFNNSGSELGSGLIPELTHSTLFRPGLPTNQRHYDITAITLPIEYNEHGDVDPHGAIFALSDDVAAIRAGDRPAEPLVVRSNVGEAVQITLRSALEDSAEYDFHSKVGMHIHLVQYDVQSSDGAVAGFNYETSVRPSIDENGDPVLGRKACGKWDPTDCGPLDRSDEVVHTTWFSDTELGTVYWHDHSKLVVSLPHGLFAALIVEPEGSEYRDRETGEDKYVADDRGHFTSTNGTSGTQMADIVVPDFNIDPRTGEKRADFREFFFGFGDATTLFGDDDISFSALEHGESRRNPEKGFASINLRMEHFNHRLVDNPDESLIFSSFVHGDPSTPLFKAYVGDPVSIRVEGGGTNSIHVLGMHGHRWRFQRGDPDSSPLRDFVVSGQSEGFSFDLEPNAGGLAQGAGDYLYFNGNMDHRREGGWGIFRVHDTLRDELQPLPDRPTPPTGIGFPESIQALGMTPDGRPPQALGPGNTGAPADAPVRRYDVVAIDYPIPYDSFGTPDIKGKLYVLAEDVDAVLAGTKATEPLVLRANVGEVVEVQLRNQLADDHVGLHPSLVQYDVQGSDGSAVGWNTDQTVAPGTSKTYRWYADEELGTVYLYNPASLDDTRHGLFGALIVEPEGSTWRDPVTGGPLRSGVSADVIPGDGGKPFREFVIFFHDGVDEIRYRVAINYRTARRAGANEVLIAGPGGVARDDREYTVHSSFEFGDPVTPVFRAYEGDRVIVRQLQPAYEDHHVFHLHGHAWFLEPGDPSSQMVSNVTDSVGTTYDMELIGGARAGDHPFHCHIMDHKKMGMWGLVRVHHKEDVQADLLPLPEAE
ncbi:MAG: multicopper oxidase domain-containing protein [Acidobacteriota bacterium]